MFLWTIYSGWMRQTQRFCFHVAHVLGYHWAFTYHRQLFFNKRKQQQVQIRSVMLVGARFVAFVASLTKSLGLTARLTAVQNLELLQRRKQLLCTEQHSWLLGLPKFLWFNAKCNPRKGSDSANLICMRGRIVCVPTWSLFEFSVFHVCIAFLRPVVRGLGAVVVTEFVYDTDICVVYRQSQVLLWDTLHFRCRLERASCWVGRKKGGISDLTHKLRRLSASSLAAILGSCDHNEWNIYFVFLF